MSQSKILNHLISRITSDVDFLVAEGLMARYDADQIIAKLPTAAETSPSNAASSVVRTPVNDSVSPIHRSVPPPPPSPAVTSRVTSQAKALWGYNEDISEPNDLSFPAGATIELIEETNADWWKGRVNGREGLFPSSYVEKLPSHSNIPPAAPVPSFPTPFDPEKAALSSQGYNNGPRFTAPPPPPPGGYGYGPPIPWNNGPPPPPPGQQELPPPEKKKSKFGKFGSQAGSAAASGVGFGAGAAIGSGIVNAIF